MKTTFKTTGLLFTACLLSTLTSTAQSKEPTTVHIKKIETVNGVKTVSDTTYTVGEASSIILNDGTVKITGLPDDIKEGSFKTIILNDKNGGKITLGEDLDKQIDIEVKNALKEAGIDETTMQGERIIIINGKEGEKTEAGKQVMVTKTVVKRIDIKDADEKELKRLGQSSSDKEQKLKLSNMNFYPNPNTGKFNLSFNLPEKGDTDITILDTEGKVVYTEKLPAFSGNYTKEIDISKQAKGIYFVKVEQGKNSQVKKIVLE